MTPPGKRISEDTWGILLFESRVEVKVMPISGQESALCF